jgi:hypothetical protein
VPENDKFKDYARYADTCLKIVAVTTDQELRRIQREMAAGWLRPAQANANGMMQAAKVFRGGS